MTLNDSRKKNPLTELKRQRRYEGKSSCKQLTEKERTKIKSTAL